MRKSDLFALALTILPQLISSKASFTQQFMNEREIGIRYNLQIMTGPCNDGSRMLMVSSKATSEYRRYR